MMQKIIPKFLRPLCRNFKSSAACADIFNIQDKDDFETRVVKSDKPVLVDFHAK